MACELELTRSRKTLEFLGRQVSLNNSETGKPRKETLESRLASANRRQENLGDPGKAGRLVKSAAGKF